MGLGYYRPFGNDKYNDDYMYYGTSIPLENYKIFNKIKVDRFEISFIMDTYNKKSKNPGGLISNYGLEMKGYNEIYEKYLYFVSSIKILQSEYKYEDENFIDKNISIIPSLGFNTYAWLWHIDVSIYYSFNNLKNEKNQFIINGLGGSMSVNLWSL